MRITKSLKLSFILSLLFAFHLTCSSDFGEPGELGSISIEIIFDNDSNQSSKQSHDWIDPVKDVIKITKAKSVSSGITGLTITIPGVDTVDVDVSPGQTVSEIIDGVPVGQQTIRVDLKNIAGTILYTQTQTVQVLSGETSSPSFSAEGFIPENQFIDVISPNGGENWELGSTHTITWISESMGLDCWCTIELYQGDSVEYYFYQTIVDPGVLFPEYSWIIPDNIDEGSNYKIKVSDIYQNTYDFSDSPFTLSSP